MVSARLEQRGMAASDEQEEALRLTGLPSSPRQRLIDKARNLLDALARVPHVRRRDPQRSRLYANLLKHHPVFSNSWAAAPTGDGQEMLTSTLHIDVLLDRLAQKAARLVNAERGCAGLCTPEGMVCRKYFKTGMDRLLPNAQKQDRSGFARADREVFVAVSQVAATAQENGLAYQAVSQAEEKLRIAEERFRLATRATSDVIWDLSLTNNTVWVSDGIKPVFGYDVGDTVDHAWWRERIHPDDRDEVITGLHAAVNRGDQLVNGEFRVRRADGSYAIVITRGFVVRAPDGTPLRVVGATKDITDRRQAQEEARRDAAERAKLEAQLVQSAKMASLGVMAGGIAHELRNPLAIMSTTAQLLLNHPEDEALRREGLQKITSSVRRASTIIENLLKFAGPMSDGLEEVQVNELLEETLTILEHWITLQKVSIQRQLRSHLPPVYGNRDLLVQVFTNLILNACNALPGGGTLAVSTATDDRSRVEIRFVDTGIGIPPEHLPRIFDPFFTTKPPGRGTGLGLAVSYRIIEQHGGSIEVNSKVGMGSVFTIRLPHHAPGQVVSKAADGVRPQ